MFTYVQGAELPDIQFTWRDSDGTLIDFGGGAWTFTLRIGQAGQPAVLEKTANITGSSTPPNIVVAWTSTDLQTIPVEIYDLQIIARHVATSKDRILEDQIQIRPAILPPA